MIYWSLSYVCYEILLLLNMADMGCHLCGILWSKQCWVATLFIQCVEIFAVWLLNKMAQDVGMVWKFCGVILIYRWKWHHLFLAGFVFDYMQLVDKVVVLRWWQKYCLITEVALWFMEIEWLLCYKSWLFYTCFEIFLILYHIASY